MFTFTQLVITSASITLAGWLGLWLGYRLGAGTKLEVTANPLPLLSIPEWVHEIIPEKPKPPDDETLNPTWQ